MFLDLHQVLPQLGFLSRLIFIYLASLVNENITLVEKEKKVQWSNKVHCHTVVLLLLNWKQDYCSKKDQYFWNKSPQYLKVEYLVITFFVSSWWIFFCVKELFCPILVLKITIPEFKSMIHKTILLFLFLSYVYLFI